MPVYMYKLNHSLRGSAATA